MCLKFRRIKQSKYLQQRATDAALSSYVVNEDSRREVMRSPIMAFSLCYVASHYGLNLIDENASEEVLQNIEGHLNEVENQVES